MTRASATESESPSAPPSPASSTGGVNASAGRSPRRTSNRSTGCWRAPDAVIDAVSYVAGIERMQTATRSIGEAWADIDVLRDSRPCPSPPFPLGQMNADVDPLVAMGRARRAVCASRSRSTQPVNRRCRSRCTGATTAFPSAFSSSAPTAARTCSCGSPPNSNRRVPGPTVDRLRSTPDQAARSAGASLTVSLPPGSA